MARIAILCQSRLSSEPWHVRGLPHLIGCLLRDDEHKVELLGCERLEGAADERVRDLTGKLSLPEMVEHLRDVDLAICVDEQCALARQAEIPVVGIFAKLRHIDMFPPAYRDLTAIYSALDAAPDSVAPTLVAEKALRYLSDRKMGRHVLRGPVLPDSRERGLWSIIVVVHDTSEDDVDSARRCIEAIRTNSRISRETIAVSVDPSTKMLAYFKSQGDVRTIHLRHAKAAEALCVGVEAASGEILLFLHAHQYVAPSWEDGYISFFRHNTGIVGTSAWCIGEEGVNPSSTKSPASFLAFGGAAIRRDVLQAAGGFDATVMPEFAEMADICWRCSELGFDVALLDNPKAERTGPATRRGMTSRGMRAGAAPQPPGSARIVGATRAQKLPARWPESAGDAQNLQETLLQLRERRLSEATTRLLQSMAPVATAPDRSQPGPVVARQLGIELSEKGLPATVAVVASCGLDSTGGAQRPAQLARAFAEPPGAVVYVSDSDDLGMVDGIVLSNPTEFHDLIAPMLRRRQGFALFGLANLMQRAAALGPNWVQVFDLCDDWEAFHRVGHLDWFDKGEYLRAFGAADLVTCSAQHLVEIARGYGAPKTALIRNAGPARPFPDAPPPADFLHGEVNVVFIGSLWGKWFDWHAFRTLCQDLEPLGGVVNVVGGYAPAHSAHLRNVRWHGELPYHQAMRYGVASDIGIIPFCDDTICRSVDPIKYYDYVAAQCHTVATDNMSELKGRPYCHLSPSDGLIDGVRQAMHLPDVTWARAEAFCRANSWEARCAAIRAAVSRL